MRRVDRAVWLCLAVLVSGIPAAAAASTVAGNTNLAAAANGGRVLAVSSELLDENGRVIPEWQAANLIDGKHVVGNYTPADSYGWSSQFPPSPQRPEWVIIGFADPKSGQEVTRLISRIVIDPTTDDTPLIGRWIQAFTLEVSTSSINGPWRQVGRYLVDNRSVKQTFDFLPVEAKYVRVLITSNHGSDKCVQMGEVEIYEAIVPDSALDQLIIKLENLLEDMKRIRDGQVYQQRQASLAAAGTKPPPEQQPGGAQPARPLEGDTPAVTPPVPPEPEGPPGPAPRQDPLPVDLGIMALEIPPGWEQGALEGVGLNVKLFLLGPSYAEGRAGLTVIAEPLEAGTTLVDFVRDLIGQWPGAALRESASVQVGGVDARRITLTSGGRVFVNYCLFHEGQGITITATLPAGAADQASVALQPLIDSIELR